MRDGKPFIYDFFFEKKKKIGEKIFQDGRTKRSENGNKVGTNASEQDYFRLVDFGKRYMGRLLWCSYFSVRGKVWRCLCEDEDISDGSS